MNSNGFSQIHGVAKKLVFEFTDQQFYPTSLFADDDALSIKFVMYNLDVLFQIDEPKI